MGKTIDDIRREKLEKILKEKRFKKEEEGEGEKGVGRRRKSKKIEDIGQLVTPPTWGVKIRPSIWLEGRALALFRLKQALTGLNDSQLTDVIVKAYLDMEEENILNQVQEAIRMIKEGKKKEEEEKKKWEEEIKEKKEIPPEGEEVPF